MIAMPLGSAVYWTTAAFLIASALTILMGIFGPSNDMLTVMVKSATGLVMLALPLLRLFAAGGPGWGEAIAVGQPIIPTLAIAFLLTVAWLVRNCWQALGKRRTAAAPQGAAVQTHTYRLRYILPP